MNPIEEARERIEWLKSNNGTGPELKTAKERFKYLKRKDAILAHKKEYRARPEIQERAAKRRLLYKQSLKGKRVISKAQTGVLARKRKAWLNLTKSLAPLLPSQIGRIMNYIITGHEIDYSLTKGEQIFIKCYRNLTAEQKKNWLRRFKKENNYE